MQKEELPAALVEKDQAQEMEAKACELKAKAEALKAEAEVLKARASEIEAEAEKVRVECAETEANAAKIKAKISEIKGLIARKVREDSRERSFLTAEDIIISLDDDLQYGRIDLNVIRTEMAAEEEYQDIKDVTTPTGLVFLYSDTYITADAAAAKSLVEEAKFMLASVIRRDSSEKTKLTPVGDIYAMAPDSEPAIIDAILKGMQTEERYTDIAFIKAANGDVYCHSEKYLVGSYAATLMLAEAGDHCATIAKTVRDDSRIYPATTNAANFQQKVYGVPYDGMEALITSMMRNPAYSDIKKMVHPATGGVHLYSDRHLTEDRAWAMMDWDEVGRANNP